jgi:hypothetical protein
MPDLVNIFLKERFEMDEARQKFEALIAAKGRDVPAWSGTRYTNDNIQTYWRWFYLGWTMTKGQS